VDRVSSDSCRACNFPMTPVASATTGGAGRRPDRRRSPVDRVRIPGPLRLYGSEYWQNGVGYVEGR